MRFRYGGYAGIVVLAVSLVLIGSAIVDSYDEGQLKVHFFDVGQGDAAFIESPSGAQMLIDGGKGSVLIERLSDEMRLFDRSIDVVVATHPDLDHIGGLPKVLERYDVGLVVKSSVLDEKGSDAEALDRAVEREHVRTLIAERGDVIDLGGGVQFEILFPDRDVPHIETNTGSVVGKLIYGNTSFLFTGDSPIAIEEYLASLDGAALRANVLKVGHHGSKTSSSPLFIGYVQPLFGVLSRGCNNSYGHPHQEVIDVLKRFEAQILDTCERGTITFVSDGQKVTIR